MLKGSLLVDALIGIFIIACCISIVGLCVNSYYQVENEQMYFSKWQMEEYDCEVWCDGFWFYDD